MIESASSGPIVIDGATGYVGSHLTQALCREKRDIRCIVHPGASAKDIAFLESCGAKVFRTELDPNQPELIKALSGAAVAVHLIGSIAPKAGEKLEELHAGQTGKLVRSCQQQQVPKIVMVTALGCEEKAASDYHKSKWQAEELVRNSGLNYVILRPSLIVGRLTGERDSKLIARYRKLISERPSVPLLGGGKNLMQPVFIGDLIEALKLSVTTNIADKQTLEIGGPNKLDMHTLVSKLMQEMSVRKPLKTVPLVAAGIAAFFLEKIQAVPLVSRDQVKMASADNVCRVNSLESLFKIKCTSLEDALSTYVRQPVSANRGDL